MATSLDTDLIREELREIVRTSRNEDEVRSHVRRDFVKYMNHGSGRWIHSLEVQFYPEGDLASVSLQIWDRYDAPVIIETTVGLERRS